MLKKIGNFLLDIVFVIVVIIAIIMIMLSINSSKEGISSFLGFTPFSIETNAMEPTIMSGDLIIVKQNIDRDNLAKDDIVSFFTMYKNEKIVQTSRIIEVRKTKNMTAYITEGDNQKTAERKEIAPGDIIGLYTGTKIAKWGVVYEFLNSKNGFLICIIIPLFIFFVYQFIKFIKVIKEMNESRKKEEEQEEKKEE